MRARAQRARRTPSRPLLLSLFGMAAAAVLAGAGCGRIAKNTPGVGGESHFLHWCDGSCEDEGLACISGLCTRPCVVAEPNACSAFSGASCTDRSIEPGAVAICDVSCASDTDCAGLGGDYRCAASFCRATESGRRSTVPTDAGTGGGGAPATDSLAMPGVVASAGAAAGTAPDTLAWEMVGGVGPGMVSAVGSWPSSALMGCSYSHELTRNVGLDDPTPSPCHAQLDCAAPEIVELNTLLRDPAIYSSDPATICSSSSAQFCFGLSPRETDDVTAITLFWGQTEIAFVVGPPCGPDHPNYGKPGCDAPPIVGALIDRLKAIDALGLADPACAGFVEAPTTDTGARP